MLHLGIIGTGRIARIHLDTLKGLPGIRIAALCDLDPSALALAAKRVTNLSPGADLRLSRDPAELLELPLDGLLICTPNDTHKDLAVAALAAGKPVFCEKPMALSVRDSLAMARESRSRDLPLQVGHNYRHSDIFRRAAEIAGSGRLGELTLIVVRNFRGTWTTGWRFEEGISGGTMFDDNIHFFDLFNWFSGSQPVRVRCFKYGEMRPATAPLTHSDQERSLVTVEYDSGLVANLLFCAPTAYRAEVEVVGTEGRLEIGLGPCRLVL
ncbi:MAG: Gfo/Idh/MocA family oxidoreductase, partial [Firmicutes bacterium]|nr:Gfo/Idh/MocA family oxidoreductase [Bacillota bacterium]